MYVKRNIDLRTMLHYSWKIVVSMAALSTAVWYLHYTYPKHFPGIPFLPVATIGTAVAFYVGFKNNSSYDRLWEARKIWGEITNLSRSLGCYLMSAAGEAGKEVAATIVRRHILYVNVLRAQLRKHAVWEDTLYSQLSKSRRQRKSFDDELSEAMDLCSCSVERGNFLSVRNSAKQIMSVQIAEITALKRAGVLDAYETSDLLRLCTGLIDQQGKAERIKNFPFPRQYASYSEVFVYIFIFLLPFGLMPEFDKTGLYLSWLVIPFSTLIGWIFTTMERIGDTSENPFEYGPNDVPMTAICRQIEIDLRELLGDEEIPIPIKEVDYILM